jgi:hypothetical protein
VATSAVAVVLAALVWWAAPALSGRDLVVPAVLAAYSLVLFVTFVGAAGIHTPRYGVPAALLLWVAVVTLVDRARVADPVRFPRGAIAGGLAVVAVVWGANLRIDTARSDGPRWSEAVAEAAATCATSPPGASIAVPTTPVTDTGPWLAELPCASVLER